MAAISGEIVTPGAEDPNAEDGREFVAFTFGQHEIHVAKPTDGQLMIVLALLDLQDEPNTTIQVEGMNNFGVVVRSLFTRARDRQVVHRALAAGTLDLPDYFDLALDMIREWAPERLGNREERRAQAKKAPIAKRAARSAGRAR